MRVPIPEAFKPYVRRVRSTLKEKYRSLITPLLPPISLHCIGSGDFLAIGDEFFGYFNALADLKPDERVLDIGCGTGRMARPLAGYLKKGSYYGIDIVKSSVEWCQQ